MFPGFSARTTSTVAAPQSPKMIIPITSRHAIIQNSSSNFRNIRKSRTRQMQTLHNEILNDDEQWKEFQLILQQKVAKNGITHSAVTASLFDALESFQRKDKIDLIARKVESNITISQPRDISAPDMMFSAKKQSSLLKKCPKMKSIGTATSELLHKLENSSLQQTTMSKRRSPNEYDLINQEIKLLLSTNSLWELSMKDFSQ